MVVLGNPEIALSTRHESGLRDCSLPLQHEGQNGVWYGKLEGAHEHRAPMW